MKHRGALASALAWLGMALAGASCQGADRDALLAGKACDQSQACAHGYVCDVGRNVCVPEGTLAAGGSTSSGHVAGSGGQGGAVIACDEAADCPGTENACEMRTCEAGSCGQAYAAKGADCAFDGGTTCDGAGHCVPANCIDAIRDGDETDVDCGGSCAPCENGMSCRVAEDCSSGFCEGGDGTSLGTCAACTSTSDCGATVAPSFCDAGLCTPRKADGQACDASEQCTSGHCPAQDGLCCDAACDLWCEACSAAKTGGSDGSCALVASGADPDGECPASAASSCGATGAGCDGSQHQCILYDASTPCSAASCVAGMAQPSALCDGQGTCNIPPAFSCAPYVCDGTATSCLTDCSVGGDADCDVASHCIANQCVAKKALGSACSSGAECLSAQCADGVCCDSACTGSCQACIAAKTVAASGTCAPITPGTDPDSECGAGMYCDGMGGCATKPLGAPCGQGSECQSGICSDGVCCNALCGGTCEACHMAQTNQPSGTCMPIPMGLDPANECGATQVCNGGGQCKRVDGASCNNNGQCLSGDCCQSNCPSGWQNTCLPVSCSDTVTNFTETDTDCGGPICRRCGAGLACGIDNDCISNSCQASTCN